MQSEVARLNSLSLHPLPSPTHYAHPTSKSLSSPPLVSKLPSWDSFPVCVGSVNDTVILKGIKQVDDILVTLMKTDT